MNTKSLIFNLRHFFGCMNLRGGVLAVLLTAAGALQAQNAQKPVIARQPARATCAENATARFYVNAYSTDGGYLTYQWYRSQSFDVPQTVETVIKAGATTEGTAATLITTTPAVSDTEYYYYWVEITNHKDGQSAVEVSALAQAKIVDRTLEDHIINGDFTQVVDPDGSGPKTVVWDTPNSWGVHPIDRIPGWETTHAPSSSSSALKLYAGKQIEIQFVNGGTAVDHTTAGHGPGGSNVAPFYIAELSAGMFSSIYQDVATVPGKIYEWSLDHCAISNSGNTPDVMAVIIGSAINSSADYGVDITNRYLANQSFTDGGGAYSGEALGPYDYPYGQHAAAVNNLTGEIDYNNSSSYFYDILMALSNKMGLTNPTAFANYPGQSFAQEYNGNVYYIYICSTPRKWTHYSGVYTIPAGQGTTVFGFVGIKAAAGNTGNGLDNVVFASGSPLALLPTITYYNDVSLSMDTKAGYVYGLMEMRGSSVSVVTNVQVVYDPDGDGALPADTLTVASLGYGGWYSSSFVDGGVITISGLTPDKTYRIAGIPQAAVNTALHVNETPAYVLDEGYYYYVQTEPAFPGNDTTVWNIDVDSYTDESGVTRGRVTVKNALIDVEYALLDGDATNPVTTGPAHTWTDWKAGAGRRATFDDLDLDTYYYLVARPYGYNEVTYAAAASKYIRIRTPGTVTDIDPADVSRDDCTEILLDNSKTGYTYAVVEIATGHIISEQEGVDGTTLTFAVPDPAKAYQIVTKSGDVNWLRGVRVYGCPEDFLIDFWQETVNSSRDASGYIPTDIEYRLCGLDIGHTWIVGGPDAWTAGVGTQPLNLSALTLAGNTRSILDSLQSLDADATLYYRVVPEADYTGLSVGNVWQLVIPRRPYAPVSTDYEFDYEEEEVLVRNVDSLQFAPVNTGQWTSVLRDASWTFAVAGWGDKLDGGASELPFGVRFGATSSSFASIVRPDTIPPRAAAPAVRMKSNDARDKIVIIDMISGTNYAYRTDVSGYTDWHPYTPGAGITESDSIPFTHNNVCYVRYPATSVAPASFSAVLLFPIAIQSIHFADLTYGDTPVGENVIVINSMASGIKITGIRLEGANTQYYTLTGPSVPADSLAPANGVNNKWMLRPINGLSSGVYDTQLKMTYDDNGVTGEKEAYVYLRVDKAVWDMSGISGAFDMAQTRAQQLVLNVSGAPAGAELSYYNGMTAFTGNAESTVDGNGETGYTFTSANGLQPASTYSVGVVALEDNNH
jgi:hypothetical protein